MSLKGKYQFQISAFVSVVQKPIIPDLLKSGREYMHQIPADEFRVIQSDLPSWLAGFPASGRKSHLLFIHRQDTAVGYGNLMGIPAQIFDGIAKSVESFFYVRAPVLFIKNIPEFSPFIRVLQFFTGRREIQLSVFEERLKACKKFTLEFIPEDLYPDKEAVFCFPYFMVGSKSAAGNDAVHMHMVVDLLVPGVEYLDDTGCCSEMLFIRRKF